MHNSRQGNLKKLSVITEFKRAFAGVIWRLQKDFKPNLGNQCTAA
jgi:hypothetical protein